jgi:uncharacterized protein
MMVKSQHPPHAMKPLSLLLFSAALGAALPAQAASFNCRKAHSYTEKLVCGDAELSALDDTLEAARKAALATTRDKRAFRKRVDEKWLEREKGCHDRACVLAWYETRIAELRGEATGALTQAAAAINRNGGAKAGPAHAQDAAKAATDTAPAASSPPDEKPAAKAKAMPEHGSAAAPKTTPAAIAKPAPEATTATGAKPTPDAQPAGKAEPAPAVKPAQAADGKPASLDPQPSAQDILNAKAQLDKYTLDVAWEMFNEMKVAGTAFLPMANAPLPAGVCPTEVLDKRGHDDFIVYRFNCDMQTVRFQPKGAGQLDLTLFARPADKRRGDIDFNRNCVLKVDGVEMAMVLCKEVGKPGFFAGYRNSLREALGKALANR